MLDCSGNTDGKVYIWTYRLTGLSYLTIYRKPFILYNSTGTTYGSTDYLCEIFQQFEVFLRTNTTSTGYKNFCIHDVYGIRNGFYYVKDFNIFVVWCKSRIIVDHFCFCTSLRPDLLHNTRTNGCHLRAVVRTCDRSDRISTKCRTSHKKLIVLLLIFFSGNSIDWEVTNLKYCTVSGQTCLHTCGNTRTKVTADCCSTYQHDIWFVLIDYGSKRMRIWLCSVIFQFRIVYNDNLVCTILSQCINQSGYSGTDQNSCYICIKVFCKFICFSKQLKCDAADFIVYLLCIDKYTFIFF